MPRNDRAAEVWAALRPVTDPELDESVVELGFVHHVAVTAGQVEVAFRLPTFWCGANFAFIMAEDMRDALRRLAWVETTDIRLVDHFAAPKINAGIARGAEFPDVFGGQAADNVAAIRATFRRKAYLGRMSALIELLRTEGRTPEEIVAMRVADLHAGRGRPGLDEAIARFLELRVAMGGPAGGDAPAFRMPDGAEIATNELSSRLRDIRMTRRSAEANGEMCRMLLAARYSDRSPTERRR